MDIIQYFYNLFLQDKDIEKVLCTKCEKESLEHNLFKENLTINNIDYWYDFSYLDNTVIVYYCEV